MKDFFASPWAIDREHFDSIRRNHERQSEKISAALFDAPPNSDTPAPAPFDLDEGIATINVTGILEKRMSLAARFGFIEATSTEDIRSQLTAAVADPGVQSILLFVDSPGGPVEGALQLSDAIFAVRGVKPIVAFVDSMAASAAYWAISSADKVILADRSTEVGSIGVIATHTDISKQDEMDGRTVTEVVAGEFKAITSEHTPLTQEGFDYIKSRVDAFYTVMVESIARNLGTSVEAVVTNVADGRVFMAEEAIALGLADGIATIEDVRMAMISGDDKTLSGGQAAAAFDQRVRSMIAGTSKGVGPIRAGDTSPAHKDLSNVRPEVTKVDLKALRTEHPELAAEVDKLVSDASAESQAAAKAAGIAAGAEAERQRITDIETLAASMPGHEDLIATLKADGKTTSGEAAQALIAAEGLKRDAQLKALKADGKKVDKVKGSPTPDEDEEHEPTGTQEEIIKAKWEGSAKLRAEFGAPDGCTQDRLEKAAKAFAANFRAEASGRSKVFQGEKRV